MDRILILLGRPIWFSLTIRTDKEVTVKDDPTHYWVDKPKWMKKKKRQGFGEISKEQDHG